MPAKDLEELEALEAEEYADEMAAEAEELALAQMRAEEAMGGGMAAVSEEGDGDTFGGEAGLEDDAAFAMAAVGMGGGGMGGGGKSKKKNLSNPFG